MWTDSINMFSHIAIETEYLISFTREAVFSEPMMERIASTDSKAFAVMIAVSINMIYSQNFSFAFFAASACVAIDSEDFLAKFGLVCLRACLFSRRYALKILRPVTIMAKQLESILGKFILTKPPIKAVPRSNSTTVIIAVIVSMVYRKKTWVGLSAVYANTAVSNKDFIAKFFSGSPVPCISLFGVISLILSTELATFVTFMPRRATASKAPVADIRSTPSGASTARQKQGVYWLCIQCVKIECALNQVLRYTDTHSRNQHFLLSRLEWLQDRWFEHRYAIARQNHIQIYLFNYTTNPLQKQLHNHILPTFACIFNAAFSAI